MQHIPEYPKIENWVKEIAQESEKSRGIYQNIN